MRPTKPPLRRASRGTRAAVIALRGIRQNNLKGFDLEIPRGRLVVVTGPSGSGKSSLAFETLFAEGQRRYIETFSPYARQFFDRMDKPRVDSVEGIPPAVAVEQRNTVRTTRSTVGTMTEICDHARVVWRNLARVHCRKCGEAVEPDTPPRIWERLRETAPKGAMAIITFTLPLSSRLSFEDSLRLIARQGYQRLMLDSGQVVSIDQALEGLGQNSRSELRVVQDRIALDDRNRRRWTEAAEQAYHFGKGHLQVVIEWPSADGMRQRREEIPFSRQIHCARCDIEYQEPSPALFSFNHPLGACPECRGFGRVIGIDWERVLPDRTRTLEQGVVKPWLSGVSAECQDDLMRFCPLRSVPTNVPFCELSESQRRWVMEGDPDYGSDSAHEWPRSWYGIRGYFRWLESKAYKMHVRVLLSRYRSYQSCPACGGGRFRPEVGLYRVSWEGADPVGEARKHECTLAEFYAMPVTRALRVVAALLRQQPFSAKDGVRLALTEIQSRLQCLDGVGLGYLTMDRPMRTLSGGETERVSLTACLGAQLVNTLYVLDEPTVGLHPRDTERLVSVLSQLRDAGNTVVVVEHEAGVMRAADEIIDLGPAHGREGGYLTFQGSYPSLLRSPSLTGSYLSGRAAVAEIGSRVISAERDQRFLVAHAVNRHNLKNVNVSLPLNRLVVVCGVSGSGKSSLIRGALWPALKSKLAVRSPGKLNLIGGAVGSSEANLGGGEEIDSAGFEVDCQLSGWEELQSVVMVDQSGLGRTPRSNPAVYVGAFEHLRELFASSGEARKRGIAASAFSFNSPQGQCQTCRGAGFEKIEMQFLSDVFVVCAACRGKRYRPHVLEIRVEPAGMQSSHEGQAHSNRATPSPARLTSGTHERKGSIAWNISDVLAATVDEAIVWLKAFEGSRPAERAVQMLAFLQQVGLGYLQLGQPINTLSGGESQRLKLVKHIAEMDQTHGHASIRPTLFLFDEPTTGLHFDDIRVLLDSFQNLVNRGHSIVVIEHNLDVIGAADWVVELGPGAGEDGGQIIAVGPPTTLKSNPQSIIGKYLKEARENDSDSRRQGGGGGEPR